MKEIFFDSTMLFFSVGGGRRWGKVVCLIAFAQVVVYRNNYG